MGRVFISHAKADESLIDAFVDLLHTGLNLKQEDIFCTSLEGTGIPRGSNFVEFIKKEFRDSQFVIMVITPAYYESVFCLCELGATWIIGSDAMPLLVPPLDYDDLKAVLVGVQAGNINDKRPLNELRDRLIAAGIASGATNKWESKRDTFIKSFPRLANQLKVRSLIPAAEHEKLKATYEEAQNTIIEKEDKIEELEATVQALRQCKDGAEVKRVMVKRTTADEQFEAFKNAIRQELRGIPAKVVDALYYDTKEEDWYPPSGFGTNYDWEDIDTAKERGFIDVVDDKVIVDESNPKMRRAKKAIAELAAFMYDVPPEFVEQFEEDHDYQFEIGNRDFWADHVAG